MAHNTQSKTCERGEDEAKAKRKCPDDRDDDIDIALKKLRTKASTLYFWPGHRERDWLTNTFESTFDVGGVTFKSVAWYMWHERAKAWSPNTDLAVLVREASTQDKAKQLSRRCTSASPELSAAWMAARLKIMARAVMKKFECSAELSRRLVETGDNELLFASRFDAFYGIGFTMKESIGRVEEWGKNNLGKMLMLVRTRLCERALR